mgnify:CR=1 FL=1
MVGDKLASQMKLRPMDFSILAELRKGRNLAANLYMDLDASRQYINERLTLLEDYGLVDRIGPNPRAGLYELTECGDIAEEYREKYQDDTVDFESFICRKAEERR